MDTSWGISLAINLHNCAHEKLTSTAVLQQYLDMVIPAIGMVAHGPSHIERFGSGSLEGCSALQFIETSSITIHCDEVGNRCFIDIFSCKEFDTVKATALTKEFFGAANEESMVIKR